MVCVPPPPPTMPVPQLERKYCSLESCLPVLPTNAEDGWSVAHWHIRGLTKRGRKPFVSKGERRTLTLAVFIKWGYKPVVVPLPDRAKNGSSQGTGASNGVSCSTAALNTAIYKDIITKHLLNGRPTTTAGRPSRGSTDLKLMHDRHPAHTSKDFKAFVSSNLFTAELLPAKAPDLSPLDYGLFPVVKNAWRRQVQQRRLSWADQCSLLIELLSNTNVDSIIEALPNRVKKCIASGGSHFE